MQINKFLNFKRPLYSASFIVMLDTLSFGLVMPVMPDLLIDLGCASISDAAFYGGMLITSFALMQFVFGPLIGNLSDRFGRRPILLLSLTVLLVDSLIKGFTHSMAPLFFGKLICGAGLANYSTACAIVVDVSHPREKPAHFGILGSALGLGFILGALISGSLSTMSARMPFYVATMIAAGNLVFCYLFVEETLPLDKRRKFRWRQANPLSAFKGLHATPGLARMMLVFFLYEIAFNVYQATWAFFLRERFDWHADTIGISLGVFGITTVLMQSVVIRLFFLRFGESKTTAFALAINALVFLLYAYVPQSWMIFALIPLSALGTIFVPALQNIVTSLVNDDAQGKLQGIVTSVRAVSVMIGPLLMTTVFSSFTADNSLMRFPGAAFFFAMLISTLSLIIFLGARYSRCTNELNRKSAQKTRLGIS